MKKIYINSRSYHAYIHIHTPRESSATRMIKTGKLLLLVLPSGKDADNTGTGRPEVSLQVLAVAQSGR